MVAVPVRWWPLLTVVPGSLEVYLVSVRVPLGFELAVSVMDQHGSPEMLEESHKQTS